MFLRVTLSMQKMSKHNVQKNSVNSHNHLSYRLDTSDASAKEASKEELAEEFGDPCEEYGGVEGFFGLTQEKGSAEGWRAISRTRNEGLKLATGLLGEQRETRLPDTLFKHEDLDVYSETCLKKTLKCLPK